MKALLFVASGALFGFLLSAARATDYAAIHGMFKLTDLHLFGVIGVAIATAALGLFVLKRAGARSLAGAPISLAHKPYHKAVFLGGIVFGVGWALSGTCPGTALAQLGEGKAYALATVLGIVGGTWLRQRQGQAAKVA
ncbi:MAG: YeeE/YedE family protein [Planctomycetaceae bacterium]|nr:YeeE/YedE family protein [Planctomycetaceae bacterium]